MREKNNFNKKTLEEIFISEQFLPNYWTENNTYIVYIISRLQFVLLFLSKRTSNWSGKFPNWRTRLTNSKRLSSHSEPDKIRDSSLLKAHSHHSSLSLTSFNFLYALLCTFLEFCNKTFFYKKTKNLQKETIQSPKYVLKCNLTSPFSSRVAHIL